MQTGKGTKGLRKAGKGGGSAEMSYAHAPTAPGEHGPSVPQGGLTKTKAERKAARAAAAEVPSKATGALGAT